MHKPDSLQENDTQRISDTGEIPTKKPNQELIRKELAILWVLLFQWNKEKNYMTRKDRKKYLDLAIKLKKINEKYEGERWHKLLWLRLERSPTA